METLFSEALNELYDLRQKEIEGRLTKEEIRRYVELADLLNANGIDISFGIEL